ncbi:MAG: hypothetical protein ACE5H0_12075 [Bacteroidota bacterium]
MKSRKVVATGYAWRFSFRQVVTKVVSQVATQAARTLRKEKPYSAKASKFTSCGGGEILRMRRTSPARARLNDAVGQGLAGQPLAENSESRLCGGAGIPPKGPLRGNPGSSCGGGEILTHGTA